MRRRGLFRLAWLWLVAGAAAAADLPGDSLYQLKAPLTAQSGQTVPFDVQRGHPVLVSMFYASCPYMCPMLISGIQDYEKHLDAAARSRLRVLMVSFDPRRDTPPALLHLATAHRADLNRWVFAAAGEGDVRKIAALLGIEYRQLPGGDFDHSTIITLLDADGRILARTAKPVGDAAFLEQLRRATAAQ